MTTGQSMNGAAGAMSGLVCGTACEMAGTVLDGVANQLATELNAHSEKLILAASHYARWDDEFARRLKRLSE